MNIFIYNEMTKMISTLEYEAIKFFIENNKNPEHYIVFQNLERNEFILKKLKIPKANLPKKKQTGKMITDSLVCKLDKHDLL